MKNFCLTFCCLLFTSSFFAQGISVVLVPDVGTIEDGVLGVCLGTDVTYTAVVDYGLTDGSDETSSFSWNFSGSQYAAFTGSNTRMASYDYPIGGTVTVEVTEMGGATAIAAIGVEVASPPDFESFLDANPGSMLLGESLDLAICNDEASPSYLPPFQGVFAAEGIEQTITFLPDGNGDSYASTIEITGAPSEAVIDEQNVLSGIFSSLEHSYLGDLDIAVTCPNGTTIVLQDQGGGSCNLGAPWATSAVDGQSGTMTPGDGLLYTWRPEAELTLDEGCVAGVEFTSGDGPDIYTDGQVASGNYMSYESLAGLDQCPINGTWIMTLTDNIGADNGYLFCWGLEIDGIELLNSGDYTSDIVSVVWADNPAIVSNIGAQIEVQPSQAELHTFDLLITDEHGCLYEFEYPLDVYDPNALIETTSGIEMQINQSGRSIAVSINGSEGNSYMAEFFDAAGRLIGHQMFAQQATFQGPSTGLYILKITDVQQGRSSVRRLYVD